ncbi:unnamed protein product, partial [Cyprideis torosa]
MELLFTLILSIVFWTGVKSACPRGYTSVPISGGERCFIVPREYKYWLDARETCINVHQGHLVEILSSLDLAILGMLFSGLAEEETKDFYDYDLWTGGITQDDGSWIWNSTGAAVNRAFTEHLPKLEKQALTIDVHSVQLRALTLHMNCENPIREPRIRNFVCETEERREKEEKEEKKTKDLDREILLTLSIRRLKEVEKALREKEKEQDVLKRQLEELRQERSPAAKQCPGGFFLLGNSCYAVFDKETEKRTYDAAQEFCRSKAPASRLVELETAEELALVKTHLATNDYECEGAGKSSLGNALLGWKDARDSKAPFRVSAETHSATSEMLMVEGHFFGITSRPIKVIDSPGFGDSRGLDNQFSNKLKRMMIQADHINVLLWCRNGTENR